ncbi:hypothetical protein M407DRAFT_29758 [Tulasnella calospora MUT 4182]|uniref:Uncharacterized protein n=1 Tax=Tulasnella calospora MUT 4182 TaxID=1051891 RepID=A0A0C3Q9H1_9AGAM|nr:hypothetical protein M407DRAFT_29758 [Tulasnella calospora MUT 4182]
MVYSEASEGEGVGVVKFGKHALLALPFPQRERKSHQLPIIFLDEKRYTAAKGSIDAQVASVVTSTGGTLRRGTLSVEYIYDWTSPILSTSKWENQARRSHKYSHGSPNGFRRNLNVDDVASRRRFILPPLPP